MGWLLWIGGLSVVLGLGYLLAPKAMARISQLGQRLVFSDKVILEHRILFGVILLLAGLALIWVGFIFK